MPLKANHQEARIGVLYITENRNLKVDIGNTIDLFVYVIPSSEITLTAGIDFMAYALSTSFAGKRLQIDAVDGFFGGNISFRKESDDGNILARFRIIHNSAHLVDGHWDSNNSKWIDDYEPIPFTKDFGEIVFAHELNLNFIFFKYYGGLSYASLVRPSSLKRWNYLTGAELSFKNLFGKFFDKDEYLFTAFHMGINGEEVYSGSYQVMSGVKFGKWNGKGLILYAAYYNGFDVFNSYYQRRVKRFGIGFSVDFF